MFGLIVPLVWVVGIGSLLSTRRKNKRLKNQLEKANQHFSNLQSEYNLLKKEKEALEKNTSKSTTSAAPNQIDPDFTF